MAVAAPSNAVLRNYTVLKESCKRESSDNRIPVANYRHKNLSDSKFKVTLTALGDVLGELAQLCLSFQRLNLTWLQHLDVRSERRSHSL